MPIRFAFDLGTTSIGWAVYDLDAKLWETQRKGRPVGLRNLGVRLFDDGRDPQSGSSHAAKRRLPRAMRRQQGRRLSRRKRLEIDLCDTGLLPQRGAERDALFNCSDCNPYLLRARAASEKISLYELGRVFWHLSKHRGFASNRKTDPDENDDGLIKRGAKDLAKKLSEGGHKTYGAYLWSRLEAGEGVRVRPQGDGAEKHYDFYPTRNLLLLEFDVIWAEQAKHHAELNDTVRDRLHETIFFQRPLRPVEPGRCTFFPERPRLARWHPAAQEFLILQQLGNLRIIRDGVEERLDVDKHRVLFNSLNGGQRLTWAGVRRTLGLSSSKGPDKLNLETGGLKHLHFNQVAAALLGAQRKPGPLADYWPDYDTTTRESILQKLADVEDPEALVDWLTGSLGLDPETASAVEKVRLPDGHLRFCREATEAMVSEMRGDVITYNEAVERAPLLAGIDFTDSRPEKGLSRLPYYNELPHLQRLLGNGTDNPDDPHDIRLGKITNPTVHIALNQFRRVINMLIKEYGRPAQVVLETTRDLGKSSREKDEIDKMIKANEKRNDRFRSDLEDAGYLKSGQRVGDMFLKMQLWEELGRNAAVSCSPFSGKPICLSDLHSDAVEIEHILPYGETLDDSPANKTLAFRDENRRKGKLSPGEAAERGIFDQEEMIARTKHLPRNKAWRFRPDAMEVFEKQKTFEDRQLHATGYLARVVRSYAETLFDKTDADGKDRRRVWILPGRMTALLRHRWGLNLGDHNRKDRKDHRHHAIDAAVIGVIDQGMIAQLQKAAKQHEADNLARVLPAPPKPFPGFCDVVMTAIRDVRVSHRARHFFDGDRPSPHNTPGALQKAGRYGIIRDLPENQEALLHAKKGKTAYVKRVPVTDLSASQIPHVRDLAVREQLETVLGKPGKLSENLATWSKDTGTKRVRLIEPLSGLRPLLNSNGKPFTHLRRNEIAYLDILQDQKGKWFAHDVDIWGLYLDDVRDWRKIYPQAHFIMRLHKGDTIQLFDWDKERKEIVSGTNTIKVVRKLNNSPDNKNVVLFGLNEGGDLEKRHKDNEDDFSWDWPPFDRLRLRRARRVRIDELGKVHTIPLGKA